MRLQLTVVEQVILQMLLAGDDDVLALLRAQFETAIIISRKMTGVGFFTDFAVPESVERTEPKGFVIDDVHGNLSGLAHGAGFLLFVRDGTLSMLEGYTYGDEEWPQEARLIEVYYMHHAPPDSPMLQRCAVRDLEQLRAGWQKIAYFVIPVRR